VLRDVTVEEARPDEVVVIGREAGVVGDVMTIEITEPMTVEGTVRVVESLPIIIDGAVRHRMRLLRLSSFAGSFSPAIDGQQETEPVPEETR
jgi:hypothetical protein